MLRWFIFAAALLLLVNASAFAQGSTVWWYYLPENGSPLTTVCGGGVPIPDGWEIKVMWDANNNGPDVADQPATLCGVPTCEGCPGGASPVNTYPFNGVAAGFGPGYFAMLDYAFATCGQLADPSKFYLRVYDTDGVTPLWTSVVYTLVPGPQEIWILQSEWTCGAGGPQCIVLDAAE